MNDYESSLSDDLRFAYRFLKNRGLEIARVMGAPNGENYFLDRESDLRALIVVMQDSRYEQSAQKAISRFKKLDKLPELEAWDAHRRFE